MDTQVANMPHHPLSHAASLLSSLSAADASMLMAAAADLVVAVDSDTTVIDVGYSDASLAAFAPERWVGSRFADCVTPECVDKAEALVSGALGGRVLVGRQVNHLASGPNGPNGGNGDGAALSPRSAAEGPDLAVTYRAAAIGGGRFMLLGSDMRPVTDLQTRLLRTQIDMDRDLRRLREAETRYRLLFRLAADPLLIVDASTQEVVDANEPAGETFGRPSRKLAGLTLPALFMRSEQTRLAARIGEIAASGRPTRLEGSIEKDAGPITIDLEPYREAGGNHLLARVVDPDRPAPARHANDTIRATVAAMPDGVLVVDRGGYIIDANDAALDFVRLASCDRLIGRRADRWIGGTNVDMQVLVSNLREDGSIRHFATVVRDELGGTTAVDVSACQAEVRGEPVYGLVLREALRHEPESDREQPYSPSHFAELVGRVSLRELVRDTADIIEKLCIEEALRQTDNNRASAADVLGLSRQSLYMKLKRYGLEDGPRNAGAGGTD